MFRGRGNISAETPQHEQAVAVAIDKDRGSEHAIKWAVDNLLSRGQSLTLLHVRHSISGQTESKDNEVDGQSEELFLSFRSFCAKKNIKCNEVVLQDNDIPNALIKYVNTNSIEVLVLGTSTRTGLFRFRLTDVPGTVTKLAPDFCSVYVIAKGKVSCVRCSSAAPPQPPPRTNHKTHSQTSFSQVTDEHFMQNQRIRSRASERSQYKSANQQSDDFQIKSPFARGGRGSVDKSFELSPEMDISFVSAAGRPSVDRMFPSFYDSMDSGTTPRFSQPDVENRNSTSPNPRNKATEMSSRHTVDMENRSSTSSNPRSKSMEMINSPHRELSSSSAESGKSGSSPHSTMEDVENEMRRLRLELKQTMDMCSMARKDALSAKHRENEFNRWKMDDGQRLLLEDARMSEEAALALVEREKAKSKAAMEAAAAAQMIAELEAQKRRIAEMKAHKESEERKKAIQARSYDVRYRKYTIEEIEEATGKFCASRKIGEGGYGPVYKGELDHTSVAIKVLRPDAAQGKSQFQQEVEVLSCIRHPNMVLLLGACPEFGCLVYEHMANGSLDDRLFRRGNTPVIPWQLRFRIAAEIATGLLFLHQSKPEPLVHRDLKPGNILLDNNYVSKISDVGLARLVPPSVADSVTQYHMTSTAGTFCYIDPEYQQTGMLGTKSDIYSLGVVLLQIITARPPMGLTHHVERAIEMGTFSQMLDPAVHDWPVEEVLRFAKLSLQCAEMRRKDRPDLGKVVLPELNRLRAFAEESWNSVMLGGGGGGGGGAGVHSPGQGSISTSQDVISRPPSGYDSSRSRSSTASNPGRT